MSIEQLLRAANKHGDLAGCGAMHAAGHGAGQGTNAAGRGAACESLDFREVIGAHLDPSAAATHDGQGLVEDRGRGTGRRQTSDEGIAHASEIQNGRHPGRPGLERRLCGGPIEVEDAELEAPARKVRREVAAQMTQSDEAVAHDSPGCGER